MQEERNHNSVDDEQDHGWWPVLEVEFEFSYWRPENQDNILFSPQDQECR